MEKTCKLGLLSINCSIVKLHLKLKNLTLCPSCPVQYLSRKNKIKDRLKDIYYSHKLRRISNEYIFIHVPKCGGTSLRKNLNINLNAYIYDWHEIKLKHLNPNQKAIVCIRNPIKRFESAFYSKIHMKKNLNEKEKGFYEKFRDINVFIDALMNDNKNVVNYLKYLNAIPIITRYSSLQYWFGSLSHLEKNKHKIKYVIKLENLNNDLSQIFQSEQLKPQPLINKLNAKPKDKFAPIDHKYISFLNHCLDEEFVQSNTIFFSQYKMYIRN